jgi:drug/metabolite transporter superfamily protein YnfA
LADTVVPSILFVLFALSSSIGAFLIVSHVRRSRVAGVAAALLTLFFFAALFLGLLALMPRDTLPVG